MLEDEDERHHIRIRQLADFTPVLTLAAMLIGGLTWGIKIEVQHSEDRTHWNTDMTALRDRVKTLEDRTPGDSVMAEQLRQLRSEVEEMKTDNRTLHAKDVEILDRLVNCEKVRR